MTPMPNPDPKQPRKTVDALIEVEAILAQRGEVYKDGFERHAKVLAALFPDGIPTDGDLQVIIRFGFIFNLVTKMVRYCDHITTKEGHGDSRLDLAGYAVKLLEVDGGTDEPTPS